MLCFLKHDNICIRASITEVFDIRQSIRCKIHTHFFQIPSFYFLQNQICVYMCTIHNTVRSNRSHVHR